MIDFNLTLQQIDPGTDWDIHQLTGGLVNFTIRATSRSAEPKHAQDRDLRERSVTVKTKVFDLSPYESLIVKYAAPYIASIGDSAPFSQFRQTIEARALNLLQANHLPDYARFPRLIYQDVEAHILIMEDLGELPNLRDYLLKPLGPQEIDGLLHKASNLGKALASLQTIKIDDALLNNFYNPDMNEVVYEAAVKGISEKLTSFGIADADILGRRCVQAFEVARSGTRDRSNIQESTKETLPMAFSMGDMWPPSILLDETRDSSALIDWEFAGPALSLQDLSQLCAHLHVYHLTQPSLTHIPQFVNSLVTAFREESESLNVAWLHPTTLRKTLWHAVILHGRELINVGTEKDWGAEGATQQEIVEQGVRYLRLASDITDNSLEFSALSTDFYFGPLLPTIR
ncbi:hypothetical protein CPB86DRAFT_705481 [Serendipita vermifera]|nr:hypothetical protein CPB86DRAFT_705481 [Serendipita vermifera]